jgi:hypothetical protein
MGIEFMRKALPLIEVILATAGLAAAIVFFAATQELTSRDFVVLALGAIVGATLAALTATMVSSSNTRRVIEVERQEEARARAEAIRTESARRLELLKALPTRQERLRSLRNEIGDLKQQNVIAKGNAASQSESAKEAEAYGMIQQAYEHDAAASSWHLRIGEIAEYLAELEAEYDELANMSDADYLTQQKLVRGLD